MAKLAWQKSIRIINPQQQFRERLEEKNLIVEKTEPLMSYQSYVSKKLDEPVSVIEWMDYKWQLKNSIKTIEAFESFMGVTFSRKRKRNLEKTVKKVSVKHHTLLCFAYRERKHAQ